MQISKCYETIQHIFVQKISIKLIFYFSFQFHIFNQQSCGKDFIVQTHFMTLLILNLSQKK